MDLMEKRCAVVVRAIRDDRLELDEALAWARHLGLDDEHVRVLLEASASVEGPGTRLERLTAMLARAYTRRRLHIDEALALAEALGFDEHVREQLVDACGATDLRHAATA